MSLRATKGILVRKTEHLERVKALASLVASWTWQLGVDPATVTIGYAADQHMLTLRALSKTTASEIFLRRGELVRLLRAKGWEIRKVVIR